MEATVELRCEMKDDCTAEVTMIDDNGYIYCESHGLSRRSWRPCRKLRAYELKALKRGGLVKEY